MTPSTFIDKILNWIKQTSGVWQVQRAMATAFDKFHAEIVDFVMDAILSPPLTYLIDTIQFAPNISETEKDELLNHVLTEDFWEEDDTDAPTQMTETTRHVVKQFGGILADTVYMVVGKENTAQFEFAVKQACHHLFSFLLQVLSTKEAWDQFLREFFSSDPLSLKVMHTAHANGWLEVCQTHFQEEFEGCFLQQYQLIRAPILDLIKDIDVSQQ